MSSIYAVQEALNEITDTKLDTLGFDSLVFGETFPVLQELIEGATRIPDPINRTLQELIIQLEESMGLSLEAPDFSPNRYFYYILGLRGWERMRN